MSVPALGRAALLIPPVALVALVFLQQDGALLNHDVAWYLIAASRMAAGGEYLTDFFEMNMPLAIGVYVPPSLLATALGIEAVSAVRVWTDLLALQCLALVILVQVRARTLGSARR